MNRVWLVLWNTDYEGSDVMGVYSTPGLARAVACKMLLEKHSYLDKPPLVRVDDLALGHFSWRVAALYTWSTISYKVVTP